MARVGPGRLSQYRHHDDCAPSIAAPDLHGFQGRPDLSEQRDQGRDVSSGGASRRQCKECLLDFGEGSPGGRRVQHAIGPILTDVRDGALERPARALEHPADGGIRRGGHQRFELFDDLAECLLHRQDRDLCLLGVCTPSLSVTVREKPYVPGVS